METTVGFVPVSRIRNDGVIVDGPNRGARSWDVHAANDANREKSRSNAAA